MKKLLTSLLTIGSAALLIVSSCKKNDAVVVNSGSKSSALTANLTTLILDKTKVADTNAVIKFNFTAPSYTYKAVVSNVLQIDPAGDNWKNPTSAALGSSGSHGYSTSDFNALLLKLNLPAGKASQVNVRVANELSNVVSSYSNVLALTVTPFNLTTWIYVPGDYEGWKNDTNPINAPNEDSLISVTGNGVYTGIVDFRGYVGSTGTLQFKLVPVKGDWTHSYGTFDNGTTNTTIVLDGAKDGNLWVPTAAPYLLTVDVNKNTITAVPANYYSVIGDAALGWGTDTEMKYLNDGNGNWVVNLPLVSTGGFKIRENNDWTYSWGIPQTGTDGAGIANTLNDSKNNNITIATSGNYLVTFYYPMSAASGTFVPVVTTTYTATKQ